MDPIFEYTVFDSAREKIKRVIRQLEIPPKALENLLCTLVSNVVATRYFPSQNRLNLLMWGRLYSMSAVIVTINGGMNDNVKAFFWFT